LAFYQLLPKLKSRERRGEILAPVPDPQDTQLAGTRLLWLIWTLETPGDRPRFRRHIMAVRWLPLIGFGLLVGSAFVMQSEVRSTADALNGPPSVTLSIDGEAEPDIR
jgi:hypothetical protein